MELFLMELFLLGKGILFMSTISSISNNTYLMYKIAAQGLNASTSASTSTTSVSTSTSASSLSSSLASLLSTSTSSSSSAATSQLSSLWSSYLSTSSSTSTAESYIAGIANNASSLNSLLSSYSSSSKTFYTQFNSTMSDLSKAASTLKNTNFNVTGATDTETASNTKTALSNIENFVSKYNDSISFFSDNSSVSSRVSGLASSFADTTYRASSLKDIGITVDSSTGKMTVDETKLTSALKDNSDTVSYLLGSNGLAGKAETKVAMANSQSSKLFPSVSSMLGTSVSSTQALYSAKTLTAMSNYTNVGTLLDMYF